MPKAALLRGNTGNKIQNPTAKRSCICATTVEDSSRSLMPSSLVSHEETMSDDNTPLVTKQEALELVTRFIDKPGVMDLPLFMELIDWQNKLILLVLQERAEQEFDEGISKAKTVPEIAKLVARLLHTCGIYGHQAIGQELARMSVTAGLGKN